MDWKLEFKKNNLLDNLKEFIFPVDVYSISKNLVKEYLNVRDSKKFKELYERKKENQLIVTWYDKKDLFHNKYMISNNILNYTFSESLGIVKKISKEQNNILHYLGPFNIFWDQWIIQYRSICILAQTNKTFDFMGIKNIVCLSSRFYIKKRNNNEFIPGKIDWESSQNNILEYYKININDISLVTNIDFFDVDNIDWEKDTKEFNKTIFTQGDHINYWITQKGDMSKILFINPLILSIPYIYELLSKHNEKRRDIDVLKEMFNDSEKHISISSYFPFLKLFWMNHMERTIPVFGIKYNNLHMFGIRKNKLLSSTFPCMQLQIRPSPYFCPMKDHIEDKESMLFSDLTWIAGDGGCKLLEKAGSFFVSMCVAISKYINVRYVYVEDDSRIQCGYEDTLYLRETYSLINSNTWYGRFGFKFYPLELQKTYEKIVAPFKEIIVTKKMLENSDYKLLEFRKIFTEEYNTLGKIVEKLLKTKCNQITPLINYIRKEDPKIDNMFNNFISFIYSHFHMYIPISISEPGEKELKLRHNFPDNECDYDEKSNI